MAKNHQTENPLFRALVKQYESEIATAVATAIVYFDSPAGVGEHPNFVEELDKQVHDKQLVRILKCSQLHASGYMINPASKYAYICSDVINIRSYVKANPEKFKGE